MNERSSPAAEAGSRGTEAKRPLLASKLYMPPIAANAITRPRLLRRLDESDRHKLTLVSAAAGSGKTTAVSDWVARGKRRIAWVSLEPGDNAFVRFWSCLADAIGQIAPGFAETAKPIFHSFGAASIESTISFFLDELTLLRQPVTLVLDDYHLIESPDIHASVAYFIESMPSQAHLLLATRTIPPLPLSRLRARRQLLELGADDLRFTLDEAIELERLIGELSLSEEEVALLEEKTEGWIAGLCLAFLSLSGREDRSSFIRAFSGDNRHVLDYLLDEVLLRQPPQVQLFLLRTSLLERLSVPLCRAVTGLEESAEYLAYLEKANLFVIPLDDNRTLYRYHHLFAETLRSRLKTSLGSGQWKDLHMRAYRWYAGQPGYYTEEIRHAMEAGEADAAAEAMERSLPEIISAGEEPILIGWLERLPMSCLIRFPNLFFYREGTQAALGRSSEARRFVDEADRLLKEEPELIPPEELKAVQWQLRLYRISISYYEGDVDAFVGQLAGDLETLERYGSIANVVNLGEAILSRGPIGFGGRLRKIAYLSASVSSNERLSRVLHRSLGGHGVVLLADLRYELNRLEDARQAVEAVLYGGRFAGNPSVLAPAYILLSKILQAEGREEQATELLQHAIEELRAGGSPRWQLLAEARLARMQVASGNSVQAAAWAERRRLRATDRVGATREYENVTLARIWLARRKKKQAIAWLVRLEIEAARADRLASRIEILLLLAAGYREQGDWPRALRTLEQAIRLAEPEGFVRLFLDEGKPFAELLSRWLAERRPEDAGLAAYAGRLLSLTEANGSAGQSDKSAEPESSPVALTGREREILFMIADGLSNEEIAGRLYISTGAVKKYAHQLYGKLEAKNRVQAVSRAKERNLL